MTFTCKVNDLYILWFKGPGAAECSIDLDVTFFYAIVSPVNKQQCLWQIKLTPFFKSISHLGDRKSTDFGTAENESLFNDTPDSFHYEALWQIDTEQYSETIRDRGKLILCKMFKILNTAESDIAHGYGLQARKVEHIK